MKDFVVVVTLVVAFAALVTIHVAVAGRLVFVARPRWRGIVALLVPPLAPIYALREGWRRSGAAWLTALAAYIVALLLARG